MKSDFANWSDVRVFLSVLRCGSTLAASKELNMAQPTVARRIEALEHALRLTLFTRDTRGFHPTEAARRLEGPATAMAAAADSLNETAVRFLSDVSRPIRITAPGSSFSDSFSAILSDFQAEHPDTPLELIASFDVLDLVADEAEIALRFAVEITDDRLICTKLTEVRSALYAAPGYAARFGVPRTEADLQQHRFVVYNTKRRSQPINEWMLDTLPADKIVSRCSDVEAMFTAVRAGVGIGPLPRAMAEDAPQLIKCYEPEHLARVFSWLVIAPDAYRRPEVKAFAAFFARRYRALRAAQE